MNEDDLFKQPDSKISVVGGKCMLLKACTQLHCNIKGSQTNKQFTLSESAIMPFLQSIVTTLHKKAKSRSMFVSLK